MKLDCPFEKYPDSWIKLPDEWMGDHAERRDIAEAAAREAGLGKTLTNFSVALALLDDHRLPGLNGNAANWDFKLLPLSVISWVIAETLTPFFAASTFVPTFFARSPVGYVGSKAGKARGDLTDEEE